MNVRNDGPPPRKVSVIIPGATVGGEKGRSRYRVVAESERPDGHFVWLEDLDGWKSITNDAERVTREIADSFGGSVRILYKDTNGDTDELLHRGGAFAGFQPARHLAPP